mmetsp:Transcript_19467/g.39175  ORF Transcript_19467/g.39175 Transcript_19467/m.39175 type:complete len:243 (-) Transcript_19467:134-862(-)
MVHDDFAFGENVVVRHRAHDQDLRPSRLISPHKFLPSTPAISTFSFVLSIRKQVRPPSTHEGPDTLEFLHHILCDVQKGLGVGGRHGSQPHIDGGTSLLCLRKESLELIRYGRLRRRRDEKKVGEENRLRPVFGSLLGWNGALVEGTDAQQVLLLNRCHHPPVSFHRAQLELFCTELIDIRLLVLPQCEVKEVIGESVEPSEPITLCDKGVRILRGGEYSPVDYRNPGYLSFLGNAIRFSDE